VYKYILSLGMVYIYTVVDFQERESEDEAGGELSSY